MPITDRELPQVVVNKLTKAQYEAATKSQDEFYIVTDEPAGPTVVQTTGQSTVEVMSQKAVTDIIGDVETILQTLNSGNGAQ